MHESLNAVGEIVEIKENRAKVVFKRQKACGDCRACASFGTDSVITEVENTLGVKVGDRVEIALHAPSVMKAGLIMYGIPLAALIAGVLIGSRIGDLAAALFGIGGAALAFAAIRVFEPKFKSMGEFDPKMTAVLGADAPNGNE